MSEKKKLLLDGDLPSPANPPAGCGFHTRCPFAEERCRREEPMLRAVGVEQRLVACHRVPEDGGTELEAA